MRKTRFILVATLAVLGAVFAFARLALGPATGSVVYLQNKATGQFVATSASVDELGAAFEIKNEGDEADGFHSDSHIFSDPGHTYTYIRFQYAPSTGSYIRVGDNSIIAGYGYHKWAVEEREQGWVIRAIYVTEQVAYSAQGKYLAIVDGKLVLTEEEGPEVYWDFLDEDTYNEVIAAVLEQREAELKAKVDAVMKKATVGTDVTELIENPNFDTNTAGWTVNSGKIELKGSSDNHVITAYNYTFDVSQTLKYLKQGTYKLQVQAFSRPTSNQGTLDLAASGAELENYCSIYANDVEVKVKNICDEYLEEAGAGSWSSHEFDGKTIYLPNNGGGFSDAFTRGMYENELEVTVGEDGILTIGIKNTKAPTGQGEAYCGYDNFRLTLVSDAKAELKALTKEAKALVQQPMNAAVKAQLESAIAASAGAADYAAASAALKAAIDAVAESVVAYDGIRACYESNRQYIPEQNLQAYDDRCADILTGLDEGTITGNGIPEMKEIVLAAAQCKVVAEPEELDVVEVGTQCYTGQQYVPGSSHGITIDWDAIAETLDIDKDDLKVYAVLPDGTLDESFGIGSKGTDGWRDALGNWATWNSQDNIFYVQFKTAGDPLALTAVGCMRTAAPITYTAQFKVVDANNVDGDWVTLKVSLDVVEAPIITEDDFNDKGSANFTVTIDNSEAHAGYSGPYYFEGFDEATIAAALGIESLDAEGVDLWANLQNEDDAISNVWTASYGFWMKADGTPCSWGADGMAFYVEWNDGQLYTDHSDALAAGAEEEYTATLYFINEYEGAENDKKGDIYTLNITVKVAEPMLDGKYYLANVESGRFWGAGNNWGTQASLLEHPDYVTLIPNEDGTYKMESQVSNGGTAYYFNGDYMDNGSPVSLTISKTEGGYTIANGDILYGYDGTSTVLGKGVSGDAALWVIYSEEDMAAMLAAATVDAPVDATYLITDANFGRNNRYSGAWTFEASNKNISGGNNANNNAESYHSVFTLSQTLDDVPNGVYALSAQGFYRQDGSDTENLPYFFLNDGTVTFPVRTGSENSMSAASVSFTNGLYTVEPIIVKVEDGTITLGAKLEVNTNLWCIWDNFVLYYYGADATIDEVAALANVDAYLAALEAAEAVDQDAAIAPAALEALQTALADYASVLDGEYTAESLAEATEALKEATEAANNSIKNGAAIVAMKALMDNTNVYTAEAFDVYNRVYEDYYTRWNDGTLTETVVNPDAVAGWRSANIFDDLLLSAWTIGGDQCADFNTSLYINTWSVEADGKENGSEMHVPFFEYWTGDANSLGANNLVATVTDLSAGTYEVEALVRVRIKNDNTEDAYGITLNVNDGEAVDVAAGETCDDGAQFRYGTFTAVGEVGEDGVLTITFNVAEDNNISWLSFKNVKYAPAPAPTIDIAVDRIINQGYTSQAVDYDVDAVLEALGVESLDDATFAVINQTTGEYVTEWKSYDGWLNADADVTTWSNGSYVCLKYPHDGSMALCTMPGNEPAEGTVYTAQWAITAGGNTVVLNTVITFVPAPKFELAFTGDVYETEPVFYTLDEKNYAEKSVSLSQEDIDEICEKLEISAITDATIYGYNPTTEESLSTFAAYDGWRDANGDFCNWTGNVSAPICVKNTSAVSSFLCYNIQHAEPASYAAYWAIANDDLKAVLVKINFNYDSNTDAETKGATAISGVNAGQQVEGIYNAQGQKLDQMQRGLNIVNGKKVLIK